MRHRKRGRRLGRSSSHRRAMLRNLASSLFLTERDAEFDPNPPKVKGRVITTLQKAKEVRPLVEKCVTLARRSLKHEQAALQYATDAERGTEQWRQWRTSGQWQDWANARAPVVAARRRVLQLLGDKAAVSVLFEEVAPRFADRDGGYTRVLRLAQPRLGDAGTRAVLEFVGKNDRVTEASERPAFDDDGDASDEPAAEDQVADEVAEEQVEQVDVDESAASDDTTIEEEKKEDA
jgi:large subunit ribosomal protein L17